MQNVLFLCADNSARSIMAEALLRDWGDGQLTAFSAGGRPAAKPHPLALSLLHERGIATNGLRSKSWTEFTGPDAPVMDLVITVGDDAVGESCLSLPGSPVRVHWNLPDPAGAIGEEAALRKAFATVLDQLERQIAQLATIPFADRDAQSVQSDLESIAVIA